MDEKRSGQKKEGGLTIALFKQINPLSSRSRIQRLFTFAVLNLILPGLGQFDSAILPEKRFNVKLSLSFNGVTRKLTIQNVAPTRRTTGILSKVRQLPKSICR